MSRQATIITLVVLFLVSVGSLGGYLLYAIPSSNADRLDRQLVSVRTEQAKLRAQLAAAKQRADTANELASASSARAAGAYARGRDQGLKDGLAQAQAQAQTHYDRGYSDGSAAAFGRFGGNWADGGFYVVRVGVGVSGTPQILARAALRQCVAVYAQGGTVWVQGPAC